MNTSLIKQLCSLEAATIIWTCLFVLTPTSFLDCTFIMGGPKLDCSNESSLERDLIQSEILTSRTKLNYVLPRPADLFSTNEYRSAWCVQRETLIVSFSNVSISIQSRGVGAWIVNIVLMDLEVSKWRERCNKTYRVIGSLRKLTAWSIERQRTRNWQLCWSNYHHPHCQNHPEGEKYNCQRVG